MIERSGTDFWNVPNLSGIKRRDIGVDKKSTDLGDWFFTEPGSGWEFRVQGQLDRCWEAARASWHNRKGATYGIIDCILLD